MANNLNLLSVGLVGVKPSMAFLVSDNTLAEVTTAGFLNPIVANSGFSLSNNDFVFVTYDSNAAAALFVANFDSLGNITLQAIAGTDTSDVSGNNLGGTGLFVDVISNVLQFKGLAVGAGLSLTPSSTLLTLANTGLLGVTNLGGNGLFTTVSGTNAQLKGLVSGLNATVSAQATTLSINTASAQFADITVGQSALAAAGKVNLVTVPDGTARYAIREIFLNAGGTNFSGGDGDRDLAISDGTTVYCVIPAADLGTLINARWGSVAVPFPAAAAIETLSAAGANIFAQYTGGTADYTAGSLVLSIGYQQLVA